MAKTKKRGGGTCGSAMYGGKRRKSRRSRRGSRRSLRGGMYGVGEAITPGALTYDAAYTGPVNAAGNAVPDPTDPAGGFTGIGGRRRRRRVSRRSRKMRGGASQTSMGTVGYGFAGTGAGGLADATQYTTQGNAF